MIFIIRRLDPPKILQVKVVYKLFLFVCGERTRRGKVLPDNKKTGAIFRPCSLTIVDCCPKIKSLKIESLKEKRNGTGQYILAIKIFT